jgi:hypothetical protein
VPPMGSFATGDPSLDELVGAEAKLLDGKVGRLGTLQNLVIIGGSAPETDAYRRVLSLRAITSKVNAILVYVPTLEGWHLLLRLAVAISRTTKFYALRLFRSLCRLHYRPSMQIDWAALPGANGSHR